MGVSRSGSGSAGLGGLLCEVGWSGQAPLRSGHESHLPGGKGVSVEDGVSGPGESQDRS